MFLLFCAHFNLADLLLANKRKQDCSCLTSGTQHLFKSQFKFAQDILQFTFEISDQALQIPPPRQRVVRSLNVELANILLRVDDAGIRAGCGTLGGCAVVWLSSTFCVMAIDSVSLVLAVPIWRESGAAAARELASGQGWSSAGGRHCAAAETASFPALSDVHSAGISGGSGSGKATGSGP
ncbi:hypothetical protein MIND_01156800 [Mycena indigotica]|uniref:Uncharacterized protein n=1 Tax=Mycena indigotica TaxID=2126181 RepID=A0A8H6VUN1_9AGAR|nr:uncharacterized protein MIND_01156800 [Mycena indigotica]KAF7292591.1 hypothetical protein MIND_01156800 [Mycena indigotica]